jgi:hypothetical protein
MTSPISYHNYQTVVKPTLAKRHKEIYDIIEAHPKGVNSKKICEILNKTPNQISGRFSEMVALDLIIVDGFEKIGKSRFGIWIIKQKGQMKIF